jgi:hypothetical protein
VRQEHRRWWEDHSASTGSSSSGSSSGEAAAKHSAAHWHCQPPCGWRAPPGSSSSSTTPLAAASAATFAREQQQLRLLLQQQHAGMAHQKAAGYVQVCVELQELLLQLEVLSAAAAGRTPQLPRLRVIRKAAGTDAAVQDEYSRGAMNSSASSSSSSSKMPAGLRFHSIPAAAVTCSAQDMVHDGLLAQYHGPAGRQWPGNNGLATMAWQQWPGNNGLATMAWQQWPGNNGLATMAWQAMAWQQCWCDLHYRVYRGSSRNM